MYNKLIEIGFIEYVDSVNRKGEERVFFKLSKTERVPRSVETKFFTFFEKTDSKDIYSFTFLFIHIHNRTVYSQTHINKYCVHKNIFVFNIRTILLYCTYYSVLRIASNDKRYKKLSYHFFYT